MMLGPKKPPLEPIALMSAIPAAADVPLRNFVGRHQKGDINREVLMGRNAKAINPKQRMREQGPLRCNLRNQMPGRVAARPQRSSHRSESNPAKGYTRAESRKIPPTISPVAALLVPSASRTRIGAQRV